MAEKPQPDRPVKKEYSKPKLNKTKTGHRGADKGPLCQRQTTLRSQKSTGTSRTEKDKTPSRCALKIKGWRGKGGGPSFGKESCNILHGVIEQDGSSQKAGELPWTKKEGRHSRGGGQL